TELGGVNTELRIDAPVPISTDRGPGVVWARAIRSRRGLVVSLIDLSEQRDDRWDAGKQPSRPLAGVRLSVQRVRLAPAFLFADPDDSPGMRRLGSSAEGRYDTAALPPFRTWALVWVREQARPREVD